MLKQLHDLEIKNKRVLLRLDLNLPIKDGKLADDTRIIRSIPTINYLVNAGAKIVIISHFGRPHEFEQQFSLEQIAGQLKQYYNQPVKFFRECIGSKALAAVDSLAVGEIMVLENLRFHPEEEKCDEAFTKELAVLGDIYINDAFSCSHRAHSSIVGLPKLLPAAAGLGLLQELKNIDVILQTPSSITAIIGGAKVSTKIPLLNNLIKKIDNLIIVGKMANTFLAASGHKIGKSSNEPDYFQEAKNILNTAKSLGKNILLPIDVVVASKLADEQYSNCKIVYHDQIDEDEVMLDIGTETTEKISDLIKKSHMLVWNGPVGLFENPYFNCSTNYIARLIWQQTKYHNLSSIIAGGDTVAAIRATGLAPEGFSYISTGGGAFLEYLEGKELPGLSVLSLVN
ncbi:phosphoglycerate kinase [Candidatus Trichorickettsia mobilis]|uniref:phosphoglycerate kinase n=1 Tax=Candidatus Trichorickettsia mobilis TaxID=1346319 RepID=UPI002930207E|nr:phosphoglycerate kinase [Candidatus Trichorickettsia mobilis]